MKKNNILFIIFALFASSIFGQIKNGNKQYDNVEYVNVAKTYDRLLNRNITNAEILQKLADYHYFNAQLIKAGTVYKKLFDTKVYLLPEYYYRYAQCLKAAENYTLADEMLAEFNKQSGNEIRAKLAASQRDYLDVIKTNSGQYTFEDSGVNSEFSDYGTAFYKNKIVFASSRSKADIKDKKASRIEEKYTDLYFAQEDLDGNYSKITPFPSDINTKYHESTPVFTKDGKTMYFTRNNFADGKRKSDSGQYTFEDSGVNSEFSDYGTAFYKNKIVFASSRSKADIKDKKASRIEEKYTDLYFAQEDLDGNYSKITPFPSDINTKYHESTPVFTKDGKTMYFTRNNFADGKRKSDSGNATLLKIYKATYDDGKWGTIVSLPFNSDDYQVAHPALSTDEKTLYFTSDMPGTLGKSDLFKSTIHDDGTFGTPLNLGTKINTEGRETFPFISSNNELFFASDGHPGLGGLDVFVTKIESETFSKVNNLGKPVNSPFDDFSFAISATENVGFVTSNRPQGKGGDDIYKITKINLPAESETCAQSISGIVTEAYSNAAIFGAKVVLFDSTMNQVNEVTSDSNGKYDFGKVTCGSTYYIRTSKEDYTTVEASNSIPTTNGLTNIAVVLSRANIKINPGDDLAKVLGIDIIYFDLGKALIRKDAEIQLSKVLDVLEQNPNIKIDVRSHTDSRAAAQANLDLSDRRAKATAAWLIAKGIDKSRITAHGFGESKLLNQCADGVKCSEEMHQLNRRSEFIIIK